MKWFIALIFLLVGVAVFAEPDFQFFGANSKFRFSLMPEDSDSLSNQILLSNLISTLTKTGHDGKPEPYLAESWSTSNDGRRWQFRLRSGATCESGEAITATRFAENLSLQLRRLSKASRVQVFDLLDGWSEFVSGKAPRIRGISAKGNRLTFNFLKRPDDFADHLTTVYFGYWCPRNFQGDKWISNEKIDSSGPFRLVENVEGGARLTLARRAHWFLPASRNSPKTIEFRNVGFDPASPIPAIQYMGLTPVEPVPSDYKMLQGKVEWLVAFVIKPKPGSFFALPEIRRSMLRGIRHYFRQHSRSSETFVYAPTFFPEDHRKNKKDDLSQNRQDIPDKDVTLQVVYARQIASEPRATLEQALRESLPAKTKLEFSIVDASQPNWWNEFAAGSKLDIRVQAVDIGRSANNSLIKEVFCTDLGVRFPDPSGRICKLVDEYDSREKEADSDYEDRLQEILADDAAVIPLYHTGLIFLYSNRIEPSSTPVDLGSPRFDSLRLKPQ
jgi:MarR-like DNA-binding transcriptional regulator SgrR of sgrS sRNA